VEVLRSIATNYSRINRYRPLGGILEVLGAGDFDLVDIYLHTASRPLATKECELPRTPLRPPAKGRISEPVTDAANRGSGDPILVHAVEPNAGVDRRIIKLTAGVLN
jgi:hypothetical protein